MNNEEDNAAPFPTLVHETTQEQPQAQTNNSSRSRRRGSMNGSGGGGILRTVRNMRNNHRSRSRSRGSSDDSYSSSSSVSGSRSRDSSVDSLPFFSQDNPSGWSSTAIPLSGVGGVGPTQTRRAPRRASLSAIPTQTQTSNDDPSAVLNSSFTMNYRVKSKAALPAMPDVDDNKPKKTYKRTTRRRMTRRNSLDSTCSSDDGSVVSQLSVSQRSGGQSYSQRQQRRTSLGDDMSLSSNDGGTSVASSTGTDTTKPISSRPPRTKTGRRASMGDTPNSSCDDPCVFVTYQQEMPAPQPSQPQHHSAHSRTGRRNSLTHVTVTPSSDQVRPRGILRRSSLGDVTTDLQQPVTNADAVTSLPPSTRGILRRSSLSDVPLPKPALRRSSLNNATTLPQPAAPARKPTTTTTTTMKLSSPQDVAPVQPYRVPSKSAQRASLSDVRATPATKDRLTPLRKNDSSRSLRNNDSTRSTRSVLKNNSNNDSIRSMRSILRRSSLGEDVYIGNLNPRSASSKSASVIDTASPPPPMGYCVPLKKHESERNERTVLSGGKNDLEYELTSPLSKSERSMRRETFRTARSSSNYYSNRSNFQETSSDHIASIPMEVFEPNYQEQSGDELEDATFRTKQDGPKITNRSIYMSESDDGSDDNYDSEEASIIVRKLDEMESSKRTGNSMMRIDSSWSLYSLAADQSQSDMNAAITPFPERKRSSIKIPPASTDCCNSSSTNQSSRRDESIKLVCMEGDNWDDEQSLPDFFNDEDDLPEQTMKHWENDEIVAPKQERRMSSLRWDEDSLASGIGRQMSLTWEDEDIAIAPGQLEKQRSIQWDDEGITPSQLVGENNDSDDESLGDIGAFHSRSSLSNFRHSSENSFTLGDIGESITPSRSSFAQHSMQISERSLGDFGDGGSSSSNSNSDSDSEESDGLIRDDEIFRDALMCHAEPSVPKVFTRRNSSSGRGSLGDYTLSLSGKGEIEDMDRSERSIRFSRSAMDNSIRSRGAISTISEDSFEITSEELGIFNPSHDTVMYPQQLAMMRKGASDNGSFVSCSSEEYASSTEFYDSDDDKDKKIRDRIKESILWSVGGAGVMAIVGFVTKAFRKNNPEEELSLGLDNIQELDDLGQSIAQSALDDSVNFTGSQHLAGWASVGDGGASGELIVGAFHVPGSESLIATAATSSAAPTTTTAATVTATTATVTAEATTTAATVAATANTMAVNAAGNIGTVAVSTTTAIGNSAVATSGATIGVGGAAGSGGATGGGVLTALGLTGSGGSTAAVMGSTIGAMAIAGTTYYAAETTAWVKYPMNTTLDEVLWVPGGCPHPNPEIHIENFSLTLDVSGMKGNDESWGWMPFSDGMANSSTSGEVLKELWEELFTSSYNDLTDNGCNEVFERRVKRASLSSSIHTGSMEGTEEAFLDTSWEVTLLCWEKCPSDPLFGTELATDLQRRLNPVEMSFSFLDNSAADTEEIEEPKSFVSEIDFRSLFEMEVHTAATAAGWGTQDAIVSNSLDQDAVELDTVFARDNDERRRAGSNSNKACCSLDFATCVTCPGVATTKGTITEGTCESQCGYEPGRLIFLQDGAPESDSCLPRWHTFCNHSDEDCCGPATCQVRPGSSLHQCLAPGDVHN